jgi:hypothetical protein
MDPHRFLLLMSGLPNLAYTFSLVRAFISAEGDSRVRGNGMRCWNCQANNLPEYIYCARCGAKLPTKDGEPYLIIRDPDKPPKTYSRRYFFAVLTTSILLGNSVPFLISQLLSNDVRGGVNVVVYDLFILFYILVYWRDGRKWAKESRIMSSR